MLKVLQLNVTANWGSTGKIAEGIGQAAMARGWESAIAYGRYMNPSQSELIKVGGSLGVYAHYARHRLLDGEGLGSGRATKKLIKRIEAYNPDIIHLHNIHDHWLNYPLLFKYLAAAKTPVVWTFHDCWAFTGGCAYFDSVNCRKWEDKCTKCPLKSGFERSERNFYLKKKLLSAIKDKLTIVPVSNWLTKFVSNSFLCDCDMTMIHNGVSTEIFKSVSNRKRVVLGVALPWSARKGLGDMIKLRDVLPSDVEIRLIGLSDNQLKSLPEGIVGLKKTQNIKELVKHYSEAAVFVNPTYSDNFPTVNIEALACGTPVVTYRTGGSPEAVDENTGIVVDKGDVNALAKAIVRVLDEPDKFNAKVCRERAELLFNKERQFDKYIDLYESILLN